jgi:hypothetical protein
MTKAEFIWVCIVVFGFEFTLIGLMFWATKPWKRQS